MIRFFFYWQGNKNFKLKCCTFVRNLRNLETWKIPKNIYIFFLIALPNRERKDFYTRCSYFIIAHESSLSVQQFARKFPKYQKFPIFPNFTLYILASLSCDPAWFILPQNTFPAKAQRYISRTITQPRLCYPFYFPFFFFFFHIQIYDRYSPTRFTISRTSVPANIFVTNAYVTQVWFFRINWQYICKFLRNERSFVIIREQR